MLQLKLCQQVIECLLMLVVSKLENLFYSFKDGTHGNKMTTGAVCCLLVA